MKKLLCIAAAAILLMAFTFLVYAGDLPDPKLTPGAINPAVTQANIQQTICVHGWTGTVRPPVSYTNKIKKQLMAAAGIPWANAKLYELDHRYPIEAGGSPTDPSNLSLQPWDGPGGAHEKDKVENQVHRDICSGKITLAQGQQQMRDYIMAHAHYIDTVRQ